GMVPLSSVPGAVVTNGASGVNLSGTFAGNGSGLANLNASDITSGTLSLNQLPSAVLLNNAANASLGSLTANILAFPPTSPTSGFVSLQGTPVLQAYGQNNFFVGPGAGNFFLTGSYNLGVGRLALLSDTTGGGNTANGFQVLSQNTTGNLNTGIGQNALYENT